MAKAREIEGIEPGTPYALVAARAVRVRADEVLDHAHGVLDTDDIERVHDMRVATRRLRAALEIFAPCFPKRALKPVLADVKRLADALGARRDPDVQLAALADFADAVGEEERPGIERFAGELRSEQQLGNATLAAALEDAAASDLRARLHALAAAAESRAREGEPS